MAKNRNLQQLTQEWDSIKADDALVAFVDSLTQTECKIIDRAILAGVITPEPLYLMPKEAA